MTDRYRFMLAEKGDYPVSWMASRLGVSMSGYYSWLGNGCPEDDWSEIRAAMERVWLESDHRFRARFVKCFLPAEHTHVTLYRVRELGIRGCTPFKSKPDLVRRDFTSPVRTFKLVGGITYLRTGQGWLYLTAVIDPCTCIMVG